MRSTTTQSNQVGRDVQNVVTEAQELLKTVKEEGASQLDAVKSKVSAQLDTAKQKFGEIRIEATNQFSSSGNEPSN